MASMAAIGKVTAFITRLGANGPELCVFDHPSAGVQLPAGTLGPDEDVCDGALREAFEETGLDDLQIRCEVAVLPAVQPGTGIINRPSEVGGQTIPPGYLARVLAQDSSQAHVEVDGVQGLIQLDALSFDAVRHLVHVVLEAAAPDEWYVTTPDGGGHCWRCHWLDVADTVTLTASQQPWLEVARHHLVQAKHPPARRRPILDADVQTDLTIEMFWAPPWSGTRALVSWLDPAYGPRDDLIQRAEAAAFTEDSRLVAVAEGDDRFTWWSFPGGRREPGESLEDTLRRELLEEACAQVKLSECVGFQRFTHLNGERAGGVTTDAMFWARVEARPFEPQFETRARRELSLGAARDLRLWANPITQRLLTRAADAERRHQRTARGTHRV
jgi:8-oxo-dGTP pyrophosphatase MutT (NUDIX family)